MHSTVSICFAASNILLMRNCNYDLCWKIEDRFPGLSGSDLNKKTILFTKISWFDRFPGLSESDLNNKTILLSKILWFVSVSQISYLPQPSASANHLLSTEKSRYFPQPLRTINNQLYLSRVTQNSSNWIVSLVDF